MPFIVPQNNPSVNFVDISSFRGDKECDVFIGAIHESPVSSRCIFRRGQTAPYHVIIGYFVPVEPKPPAPRSVSSRLSTSIISGISTFLITIWAMRSKGSIV